jgi:hypothetical protein
MFPATGTLLVTIVLHALIDIRMATVPSSARRVCGRSWHHASSDYASLEDFGLFAIDHFQKRNGKFVN